MRQIDYDDTTSSAQEGQLTERLQALAFEMKILQNRAAEAESELKRYNAALRTMAEETIPEVLDELGIKAPAKGYLDLPLANGDVVSIGEAVRAHISEDNKLAAFRWLEENDEGGMIKRLITVQFNLEQEEQAIELYGQLSPAYPAVGLKRDVHGGTLASWVRGRLEEGAAIPDSITWWKQSKIKIK